MSSTTSQMKKISKKKNKNAGTILESKVGIHQGQSVLIPQRISKEQELLYSSQVLIPTNVAGKRFALMGPLTVFEILKDTRTIFPVCYDFKPLFNKMDALKVGTENISGSFDSTATETPIPAPKDPFILDYVKSNFKPF